MNDLPTPSGKRRTGPPGTTDGVSVAIKPRVVADLIVPILIGGIIAGTLDMVPQV